MEEEEYWPKQSRLYHAPGTTYGFVGRDLDVLEIERRLLATSDGKRRNMLLVQGMGGSSKTTLLKHLMEWWQTTRFVEQVSYFGYDEHACSAGQIMDRLAQELLPDKLSVFRSLDPAAQREMLGHKMCSERHLLVLDNMESITGSILAIKNTLNHGVQQELRAFLAELLGGESMVLMGSRGPEEWLAESEEAQKQAEEYYQKALQIYTEFQDQHNQIIALHSLARLWQATADPTILTEVARILGINQVDAKKLLEGGVAED